MPLSQQAVVLFLLAIPLACVTWTITHEEIFREFREWSKRYSQHGRNAIARRFFYLFICEYCLSHYVCLVLLWMTHFRLLYPGWRGYVLALFATVYLANVYMSFYNRLRLDIRHENVQIAAEQKVVEEITPAASKS